MLAALHEADLKRWSPQMEAVALRLGQALHPPGVPAAHAYLPTEMVEQEYRRLFPTRA
ncbi:MAG: hypothetical protein ABIQ33_00845 [Caldimonas sp.]